MINLNELNGSVGDTEETGNTYSLLLNRLGKNYIAEEFLFLLTLCGQEGISLY